MRARSKIEVTRLGRGRVFTAIYKLPDGRSCLLSHLKIGQIWREQQQSISDAIRAGTAAWPLDDDMLLQARAKGIPLAGVVVKETGDIHLARTADFFDSDKVRLRSFKGFTRRCLPLRHFRRKPGRIKL